MDVLATERFRTIAADTVASAGYDAYGMGAEADPDAVAQRLGQQFPDAHFEYRTNEAGVPVRRLVLISSWEVDPTSAATTGGPR